MDRMGVLTGDAKLWEPTPSFIFRIIFASKRSRQWKCFSPPYFARGVEEPYRNARKWAEQALEAWSPSERQKQNTACETEISFYQYVQGTEQDWLSFICKQ